MSLDDIFDQARIVLARVRIGRSAKSLMIVGRQGTGKTSLLRQLELLAKEQGYEVVPISVCGGESLPAVLHEPLSQLMGSFDGDQQANDLTEALPALAVAAQGHGAAVALLIDDLHNTDDLDQIIVAMHRIAQRQLPLVLIGTGLPGLIKRAGQSRGYAERLFDYPELGQKSQE